MSQSGLVVDDDIVGLSAVAGGMIHIRLILGSLAQSCHCCVGGPPVIVAVSTDDPTLPDGLACMLLKHGPGVALATSGADHIVGTSVVTETATIPVRPAEIDSAAAVVVHFADVLPLLQGNEAVVTVAVFQSRPNAGLPVKWTREAEAVCRVPVTAGWRWPVSAAVGT